MTTNLKPQKDSIKNRMSLAFFRAFKKTYTPLNALNPPSTGTTTPVINFEASLNKK